jgi:hypothetical protein
VTATGKPVSVPEANERLVGVSARREPLATVMSCTTSAGVTPPSSLLQAHAPILNPPAALVSPLGQPTSEPCER